MTAGQVHIFQKGIDMLVLSRKVSERILIGGDIAVTIIRIGPNSVRIGIEAPRELKVVREELVQENSPGSVAAR